MAKKVIDIDEETGEETEVPAPGELSTVQNIRISALEMYYQWISDINDHMDTLWLPTEAQMQSSVSELALFIETGCWSEDERRTRGRRSKNGR